MEPGIHTFHVTLPSPPSWNAAYRIVKPRNSPRYTLAKTEVAWNWQTIAANMVKAHKPAAFDPAGQIRIRYAFRLRRSMDADNLLKLLNDAIAYGLGTKMGKIKPLPIYDDSRFLPCVESLSTGHSEPEVDVIVEWEQ